MTNQNTRANENDVSAKGKRAKGMFPRLSLNKVIEVPKAIYDIGEGAPVRRLSVFHKLGKSSESSTSRTLITVSNGMYNLTTGGYNAEFLGITERGKAIVAPASESSKYKAIIETLFENDIFSAFITKFGGKGLNDEVAIDYLKDTHKLIDSDAKTALEVFKENINDHRLMQEFSGRKVIISREMALEALSKSTPSPTANDSSAVSGPPSEQPPFTPHSVNNGVISHRNNGIPQFHFNIQIHLPDNSPPEVYDAIFHSIAKHLIGRSEE